MSDKYTNCQSCQKPGEDRRRCTGCYTVYYCSKQCQRSDWTSHKKACKKETAERMTPSTSAFTNFRQRASLKQDMMTVHDPPVGSFSRAVHAARTRFPGWNIIERFDDIPQYQKQSMRNILVAYMFMFHPYVIRHGIYLKDSEGNKTHVYFYLDNDNPRPYFSYTDVTPGNYIFIQNPLIHHFMDGQVGLRIDDPSEVSVCKIKSMV